MLQVFSIKCLKQKQPLPGASISVLEIVGEVTQKYASKLSKKCVYLHQF